MKFRMELIDCFNFSDGRMVLLGCIFGCDNLIKNCKCGLFKNGVYIQELHIITEQIIKKVKMNNYRALETLGALPFNCENIKDNKWEIICNLKDTD